MKIIFLVFMAIIALGTQIALLPAIGEVWPRLINLPLLFLVVYFFAGNNRNMSVALIFATGLLSDFLGENFFGFYIIIFCLSGFFLIFFQEKVVIKRNLTVFMIINSSAVIVWQIFFWLLTFFKIKLRGGAWGEIDMDNFLIFLIIQSGSHFLAAILIYKLYPGLRQKLLKDIVE